MKQSTPEARWRTLDGRRNGFMHRCERYAQFTIRNVCPDDTYDQDSDELQHDWQALGSQAVNHIVNKMMLALFAPSRPFFRYEASTALQQELANVGVSDASLQEILSLGERMAVKVMDKRSIRPKLHQALKHLVVVGNVLLILEKETIRVISLRNYVVKRSVSGKVIEIVLREEVMFDELEVDVQQWAEGRYDPEKPVCLYKWIKLDGEKYHMTQWLNNDRLPAKYDGRWPEARMPYRVLTWDLSDEADYGTGLVEDYAGDFAALSVLSESVVKAAILASEFRWLLAPESNTAPEELQQSENGEVVSGRQGDLTVVNSGTANILGPVQAVAQDYIRRIGAGFLLSSAVTRDAERVTAEEIRLQAIELETGLGGAYSRIAVDFQIPLAYWLSSAVDLEVDGKDIEPVIITGLDALSRNGDLDNLRAWLQDLAAVTALPEPLQQVLNMTEIAKALAAPRGVDTSKFLIQADPNQGPPPESVPPEGVTPA